MIEIEPGLFYNPDLVWFQQDERLIELGYIIMDSTPVEYEIEQKGENERMVKGVWHYKNFVFSVTRHYMTTIDANNFLTRKYNDTIEVYEQL